MKAVQILEEDHRTLERLFAEYDSARGSGRRDVFDRLRLELEIHAKVEEQIFYPAVREIEGPESRQPVDEALRDHEAMRGLVAELVQRDPGTEEFDALMGELRKRVERHARQEELEIFQEAREHLPSDRQENLAAQMEEVRRTLAGASRFRRTA